MFAEGYVTDRLMRRVFGRFFGIPDLGNDRRIRSIRWGFLLATLFV